MEKIILTENQRVDSSAHIFTAFDFELKKKNTKISKDDFNYTLTGGIDTDADAMYIVLQKHQLTKELDVILKRMKALDYFQNLKKD
ncbi:hypothetical protein N5T96_06790 [Aliarcobacter butzleri]|uniref:hypothetical protein n=1 Tax=Aliarcobacter butzleri TaxID=28197 RepID=UPI0021B4B9C1|nr:hypothetical protein [Aliarcobacter butzleri]MCT7566044.1 hypothetical protein [Aliarcobacter butzleri]MCT7573394.1 hypothetical protein [Aliarcobacter butzleri]